MYISMTVRKCFTHWRLNDLTYHCVFAHPQDNGKLCILWEMYIMRNTLFVKNGLPAWNIYFKCISSVSFESLLGEKANFQYHAWLHFWHVSSSYVMVIRLHSYACYGLCFSTSLLLQEANKCEYKNNVPTRLELIGSSQFKIWHSLGFTIT